MTRLRCGYRPPLSLTGALVAAPALLRSRALWPTRTAVGGEQECGGAVPVSADALARPLQRGGFAILRPRCA